MVTGTEILTGRVSDLNGPWLAERLRRLGVDVGQIVVVGDRADDLSSALRFLAASNDLLITSGGLGPTADDLTTEVVGQVQGRPSSLDRELEQRISAIVERLTARLEVRPDLESTAAGVRKQALVPAGAEVLEPAGTAPGLVVPVAVGREGPPVIVLPGPPRELQQMWPAAVRSPQMQAVLAGAPELRQQTLRLWGVPESDLAATLRRADAGLTGLEITTCLSGGELEIVTRYAPNAEPSQHRLAAAVRADFPDQLFSEGPTVDQLVAAGIGDRAWTMAVVESATGGAVSARLAGTRLIGGIVVPTEAVLMAAVGIPAGLLRLDEARAMADGARRVFGADVGVGVGRLSSRTAGAHTAEVHLCVVTPDGEFARPLVTGGSPEAVRGRLVPIVLHLLRTSMIEGGSSRP